MRESAKDRSQGRKEAMNGWRRWAEQETPWPVGVREAAVDSSYPEDSPGRGQHGQWGRVKPEEPLVRDGRRPNRKPERI